MIFVLNCEKWIGRKTYKLKLEKCTDTVDFRQEPNTLPHKETEEG